MSHDVATWWSNARNMLRPKMLRYVAYPNLHARHASMRTLTNWMSLVAWPVLLSTTKRTLNMQKHWNNVWEKSNDAYSLSIRVQTTLNHISIYFLPQFQRQRKCFFSERELKLERYCATHCASWKWHYVTHWRVQPCLYSYRQQQIRQSDCEISSNCGIFFTAIATNLAVWLANLTLSMRVQTTLFVSMCHATPFSARTLKNSIVVNFNQILVLRNRVTK